MFTVWLNGIYTKCYIEVLKISHESYQFGNDDTFSKTYKALFCE